MDPPSFVRTTRAKQTTMLLAMGALFILVGTTGVGAAFVNRMPESIRSAVAFAGVALMVVGLSTAFIGMMLLLAADVYLAIREDGIVLHENRSESFLAWNAIKQVRVTGDQRAIIFDRDGESTTWFVGKDARAIAAHIESVRRARCFM